MPGSTTPDALAYPVVGDPATPRTQIAALAATTQTALDKRQVHTFRWATTVAMDAQLGMAVGDMGYNEETNLPMIYSSDLEWEPLVGTMTPGLYQVYPTSVINGTLNADGSVTAGGGAAAAFCELRGVFTDLFRHYRILFSVTGTGTDTFYFRYMQGTAQVSLGGGYANNGIHVTATPTVTATNSSNSFGRVSAVAASRHDGELLISSPTDSGTNSPVTAHGNSDGLLFHQAARSSSPAAHDGIAFSRNAATITGTLKVYGYN